MRTVAEKRPEHILVVEGDSAARNVLSGFLAGRGYRALAAGADEAVPRFENSRPSAVILNVAGRTALDCLATFREIDRACRSSSSPIASSFRSWSRARRRPP